MVSKYGTLIDRVITDEHGNILGGDTPLNVNVVNNGNGINQENLGFFYGQTLDDTTLELNDNIPFNNNIMKGNFQYDEENRMVIYSGNKPLMVQFVIYAGATPVDMNMFFRPVNNVGEGISSFVDNISIASSSAFSARKNDINVVYPIEDVQNGIGIKWYETRNDPDNLAEVLIMKGYNRLFIQEL